MKSHLDEILESWRKHERESGRPVFDNQFDFLRTSLISLLEKYGEEVRKMKHRLNADFETKDVETQKMCHRLEGYNLAVDDMCTKLKEILSNLK